MRVENIFVLEHDEVDSVLGYKLICESMGRSVWKTSKVKKAFAEQFNKQERLDARYTIYPKAHAWYLKTGVPDEVRLTQDEFDLWRKLRQFCIENV